MKNRFECFTLLLYLFLLQPGFSQTGITKENYLQAIKEADEKIWDIYKFEYQAWQKSDPVTRSKLSPDVYLHWGRMDGLLYAETRKKKYAERARKVLLESSWYDNYYVIFILKQIENSGILSKEDLETINKKILDTAERCVLNWIEWGAHNLTVRGIVDGLTAVMQYFPQHSDYPRWQQKRDINLSASWGRWCIEDAQTYISTWLKPLMQYAELSGRETELYTMPMTKYYFEYFVQLMTPDGEIPKFGDGGPGSAYTWTTYTSILEKAASVYRDGTFKWAAHRLFESNVIEKGSFVDCNLVEAYLWADDSIPEEVPTDGSRLVLDDYVGKKIVFRNGWNPEATYLFLNFLDDAPFGIDGKEHLINTIPVETEKNHHGHADENAICLLMKNGSILLLDSGYRETDTTGPDGQDRADIYHNKLIVRSGFADPQMRLLPFLLDGGRYRFVRTKLMHFRSFKEVDISRTRLTDEQRGYQWDRMINYLKSMDWFIIFDIVKILKSGSYTLANLFYTQDIVDYDEKDQSWYDTRYLTYGYYNDLNSDNVRLLIYFPNGDGLRRGVEQIRRSWQTESAIYTTRADSLEAGDILVFASLLIPHLKEIDPKKIVQSLAKVSIFHTARGYGVQIPDQEGFIQINAMLDLEAEYLTENIRPRYNFESGRSNYGNLTTDARYCYLKMKKDKLCYSFFKASKLLWQGKPIFEAKSEMMGQDDGSYMRRGVSKWVAWEDEIDLKSKK